MCYRAWTFAMACYLLLVASCTPASDTEPNNPFVSEVPAFGDSIDDAAWEALGPRPANADSLPFEAIRLAQHWQLDSLGWRRRMPAAIYLNLYADSIRAAAPDEALELYLDTIRIAPLLLPPWMQSTHILVKRKEALRALAIIRQYQRMVPPSDGVPWYLIGQCQVLLGQSDEAMRSYEKAAQRGAADSTGVVVALAFLHLTRGNIATAESLQTAFDIQDPVLILVTRAKRQRRNGNVRLAAELLEEAVADSTAPAGVLEELAAARIELGEFGKAEAIYLQVLERSPEKPSAIIGLARIEIAREQFAAAEKRLTALTKRHPDNLVAQFNLATAVLEQVRRAPTNIAPLQQAEASFSQCVSAGFQLEAALWGRAECRIRQGRLKTALADAKQAHDLSPGNKAAITRWARVQLHANLEPEALRTLRRAARENLLDREGSALLRTLEDKTGLNTIPEMRYLYRKHPEDWPNGMRLGVALMATGELAEAEEVLRAVVALQPHNPTALQDLAAVLDRRKKYREAETLLKRADSLR